VNVIVSVMVEKIDIDTPRQVATIKWWLRQTWVDKRLSWTPKDYRYLTPDSQTGMVKTIQRPAGTAGGVWSPDMVLWESLFDNSQSTATAEGCPNLRISSDGTVFFSCPQVVSIRMVFNMDLTNFPFDSQNVSFKIGPWSHATFEQNTSFPEDDPAQFITIQTVTVSELSQAQEVTYDVELGANESTYRWIHNPEIFLTTEEWSYERHFSRRRLWEFPCCEGKFAVLEGNIQLRRHSHFYVQYGVIPQILMTMGGLLAHSSSGASSGNVNGAVSIGFTVALALVAHAVFFVDRLPIHRTTNFMEFMFLLSLSISLLATIMQVFWFKKLEFEENEHRNLRKTGVMWQVILSDRNKKKCDDDQQWTRRDNTSRFYKDVTNEYDKKLHNLLRKEWLKIDGKIPKIPTEFKRVKITEEELEEATGKLPDWGMDFRTYVRLTDIEDGKKEEIWLAPSGSWLTKTDAEKTQIRLEFHLYWWFPSILALIYAVLLIILIFHVYGASFNEGRAIFALLLIFLGLLWVSPVYGLFTFSCIKHNRYNHWNYLRHLVEQNWLLSTKFKNVNPHLKEPSNPVAGPRMAPTMFPAPAPTVGETSLRESAGQLNSMRVQDTNGKSLSAGIHPGSGSMHSSVAYAVSRPYC